MVAIVPHGCGMVLLSSDKNEIAKNQILDNDTTGILILTYTPPFVGTAKDPNFDAFPEGNYIHDNTFAKNGLVPDAQVGALVVADPIPDVLFVGYADPAKVNMMGELTNCLKNNGSATYASLDVSGGIANVKESTDIGPITCEQPAVKPEAP
jgi:hypothetical protein